MLFRSKGISEKEITKNRHEKVVECKEIIMEKMRTLKNTKTKIHYKKLAEVKKELNAERSPFSSILEELDYKLKNYRRAVMSYELDPKKHGGQPIVSFYSSKKIEAGPENGYEAKSRVHINETKTYRTNFVPSANRRALLEGNY